jgi:hypothetical protein
MSYWDSSRTSKMSRNAVNTIVKLVELESIQREVMMEDIEGGQEYSGSVIERGSEGIGSYVLKF